MQPQRKEVQKSARDHIVETLFPVDLYLEQF